MLVTFRNSEASTLYCSIIQNTLWAWHFVQSGPISGLGSQKERLAWWGLEVKVVIYHGSTSWLSIVCLIRNQQNQWTSCLVTFLGDQWLFRSVTSWSPALVPSVPSPPVLLHYCQYWKFGLIEEKNDFFLAFITQTDT